jgi:Ser-tRNA(Ala) deacylase AlaX
MKKAVDPRMHTAEHILNQAVGRLFGCARCFSAHIEKKKSKCDYHFARPLQAAEEEALAAAVNAVIAADIPVTAETMSIDAARKAFDLSRLPADAGERLRIVSVGDYDRCPCIGPHVASTGAVGALRITSTSHRDGVLRIRFKLTPP